MTQGDYAVFTTADDAFTVDETAVWLAGLDGVQVEDLELLSVVDQNLYRSKANALHQYLGEPDVTAREALIAQWRGEVFDDTADCG